MNILVFVRSIDIALLREMAKRGWMVWSSRGLLQQTEPRGIRFRCIEDILSRDDAEQLVMEAGRLANMKLEPSITVDGKDVWALIEADARPTLRTQIEASVYTSELVRRLHEKYPLDALVTWTDATPSERAAIFTCKHLGIPTFELRHGSWAHYLQGHFECESMVDTVLSPGDEDRLFLEFYGNKNDIVVTGKPQYDWTTMQDMQVIRQQAREKYNIPSDRPVIMYCTTWRHQFDYWEYTDPDPNNLRLVLQAHASLKQVCNPFLIVKLHPQMAGLMQQYRNFCEYHQATDYAITDADASIILPAADVVVSHQSSVISECVIYGIRSIVIEFRPYNDHGFFKGRGFVPCSQPSQLEVEIGRLLLDRAYKAKLDAEMTANKFFWAGPNDGMASERCCDVIEERVNARKCHHRGQDEQHKASGQSHAADTGEADAGEAGRAPQKVAAG